MTIFADFRSPGEYRAYLVSKLANAKAGLATAAARELFPGAGQKLVEYYANEIAAFDREVK